MAQQILHQQQLKNAKYRSWVKAGLSLKYLKEGLEIFSEDVVKQQHVYLLNASKQTHNLSAVNCNCCSLRTLQPDHVRTKSRQCPLGQVNCNCQFPGGKVACPNNVCGALYDQIIINHASTPPAPFWKNTHVQNWSTDEWAVAKCYINAPGYATKTNATDIDCTGLLHLFINSKYLQTKIQCKITGQDVFSKTRSARNSIYHSSSLEMEETEVNDIINNMIAVLEDGKEFLNRPESKAAVKKLKELKNSDFVISTLSEAETIKDAIAEIDLKESELKEIIHDATDTIKLTETKTLQTLQLRGKELEHKAKENLDIIQKAASGITPRIEVEIDTAAEKIKAEARESMENLETTIVKRKAETCAEIEQVKKVAIEDIKNITDDFSRKVEASESDMSNRIKRIEKQFVDTRDEIDRLKNMRSQQQARLAYVQSKGDLKKCLIEMYTENVVKVSPVLLQPELKDADVNQLYVDPIIEVEPKRKNETLKQTKQISSYKQVFNEDKRQMRLIYLIGEAGTGKSTFCINMIHNWCLAHSNQYAQESENIQEMKKFQFLFYITLRHCTETNYIETMVRTHYADPVIKTILEKEAQECLILLDGLDEWTPTSHQNTGSQFQTKDLPIRDLLTPYTIITTSRPWKFESLGIQSTEIHHKLRLRGVNDIGTMTERTVNELNKMFQTNKNKADFENDLSECSFEDDMRRMPMVLRQLICLWFDGKLSSFGKTEIYSNILSLHFEWANQRHNNDEIFGYMREKSANLENVIIPDPCIRTELCQEFKYVVNLVGRLAHVTLLSEQKESSLVFDNSVFRRLQIPEEVISFCLKTGILSKERAIGLRLSTRQHLSFSFVHKSMQEFLCAIHIYQELRRTSEHAFKEYTVDSLDDNIKYLSGCKTVNNILEQSNIFTFSCGFDPFLAVHLSKFLYNIVVEDEGFIDFRTNIKYEPFEIRDISSLPFFTLNSHGHSAAVLSMQNVLFSLIKEAIQYEEKPEQEQIVFLADVAYKKMVTGDTELIKYIKPEFVLSLSIDIAGLDLPTTLLEFLNDPCLGQNISALKIDFSPILGFQFTDASYIILSRLVQRSVFTLRSLYVQTTPGSMDFFPTRIFIGNVIQLLPDMKKLVSIKLENIQLSFANIMNLCRILNDATYLRQISLRKITDNPDDDIIYPDSPYIDLSNHHQLQVLDHDFQAIGMNHFNVVNLETCALCMPNYYILKSVFRVLKRSRKLKHAHFLGNWFNVEGKAVNVTKQIKDLLPSLKYLNSLELDTFQFSENIIDSPFEMQRLRKITLTKIVMYEDAWDHFLDSVLLLPRNVQIVIRDASLNIQEEMSTTLFKRRHQLHNFESVDRYARFSTKRTDV
ncbi:uncharacterized protein LOC128546563 [Mercenaria mercenaria]|uniref:uncharacterized protein LOC128546563 n=1 Tax=Mercenaria mercenaria TaxID=6596 RepID=UPI00234EE5CE|nr:uncharacterized protein LOC128546563 [Mercenaria mercenaria]XP_053373331.1 uncharacterized protein LOC128546563 [Mercenaria mercenaria]